jgi:peptide/nickel transport system substrate-binding protein
MSRILKTIVVLLVIAPIILNLTLMPVAQAQQAQKRYGGTLVVHNWDDYTVFLHNYLSTTAVNPAYTVLNKLCRFNVVDYTVSPEMAQRWEVSPDAKVWTFYLYKNIKFHDGSACTSQDVKFTFDSEIKEKGPYATQLSMIDRIETPDDYTVKFILKTSTGIFDAILAQSESPWIIPKRLWDPAITGIDVIKNDQNMKTIGTGAYRLSEWVKGSYWTLEPFKDYYRYQPYLDKIVVKISQNWQAVSSAIETGEIHFSFYNPAFSDCARLKTLPGVGVFPYPRPIVVHLEFNLKRKPFDNLKVRQAMVYAINKTDVLSRGLLGFGEVMPGVFIPSIQWCYNPAALQPSYDPKKAEQLLDEAGLPRGPDGIRFRITLTTIPRAGTHDPCEVAGEYLKKVGIDVKMDVMDVSALYDKVLSKKDFDIAGIGGLHGPDPDTYSTYYVSSSSRNEIGYNNSRIDQLFEIGRSGSTQQDRKKAYLEIQEILARDLPRIELVRTDWPVPYRTDYQGFFTQDKNEGDYSLQGVWWTKAPASTTAQTTTTIKPPEPTPAFPMTYATAIAVIAIIAVGGIYYWRKRGVGSKTAT